MVNKSLYKTLITGILLLIIVIMANLLSNKWYTYFDLTEDKRFTLESSTSSLITNVDKTIYVEVLLDGELNSSFIKLRDRAREILGQFNNLNANIEYSFNNPSQGNTKEINQRREYLRQEGIFPTTVFTVEDDQRVEKLIYPFAIVNYGDRRIPVNLLEAMGRGEDEEEAINRSSMLLEYKLASTMAKLIESNTPLILFTEGNGELAENQTATLTTLLSQTMNTGRINLDSIYRIDDKADVLIVAGPKKELTERSQFIIDQYIMNGGKVIWLIEQFFINLDSINNNKVYVPKPVNHGLDDMFFKYGIRINPNVILDLENSRIPQVFGMQGDKAQQQLFPWVFHPLLKGNQDNVIVRNIDRVASYFPSSIDVLDGSKDIESSILLMSSEYSRFQMYPSINISFDIMRMVQKPEAYNKSNLPVAVLLEGEFESYFNNRVSQSMTEGLKSIGMSFQGKSPRTSQIFVADTDIIKNLYDTASNRISPLGFNKWEAFTYKGNEDFIINSIDYLLDDYGLIEARSKNYKLRLLDQVELKSNKVKWQVINLGIPTLMVILLGLIFNFWRRRQFTD